MSRIFRPQAAFAAALLALSVSAAALADPWHKYPNQDAYWHHGSGWVFPRDVGAFKLRGSPSEIDGNDDVTSEYVMEREGLRSTAFVNVYFPSSGSMGATLDTARAAVLATASRAGCEPTQSEGEVALAEHADIQGTKIVFKPKSAEQCTQSALYFFRTPNWVVTVRASELAADGSTDAVLEEFVRALRWDTLDTDPLSHDGSP